LIPRFIVRALAAFAVLGGFAAAQALLLGLVLPRGWAALPYALASLGCLAVYARDKAAAQAGRRRTPEATLHALALAGGWPGALAAQALLRHKTRKPRFRALFWITVVLNLAVFAALQLSFAVR
jgi:uncharacterized membrane protein YsdA (DUF1294 family)